MALAILPSPLGNAATRAIENHIVTDSVIDEREYGMSIDLFDYWHDDRDARDDVAPSGYASLGINNGHLLKFGKGMGQSRAPYVANESNINQWTSSINPRTNIVANQLGNDGYPIMNVGDTESMSYLFDESAFGGKKAFSDVSGLLQIDDDGYYYYDSQENYAAFDEQTNKFIIYDTWGINAGGSSPNGQFFPFNPADEVFDVSGDTLVRKNINSVGQDINHYFGVHMSIPFTQTYGGHTTETQTTPLTYEFAGDDDVWVFVDGVLVGDIGGIHDRASLGIDFSTGNITVNGNDAGTILSKFEEAAVSIDGFIGNTFADETDHRIDFFYLERGNTDSNMFLRFNVGQPHLILNKEADPKVIEDAVAGKDVINYTFTLTNNSQVPLNDVQVTEDKLLTDAGISLDDLVYEWPNPDEPGHLDVNESATAKVSYTVTQEDIDAGKVTNTAHAQGTLDGFDTVVDSDKPDPEVETKLNQHGKIAIEKTVDKTHLDSDEVNVGAILKYGFTVTNTGNVTLMNVSIDDPMFAATGITPTIDWESSTDADTPDGTLAPGESVTASADYAIKQTDIDAGVVTNVATSKGTDPNGTEVVSDPSDVETTLNGAPSIELQKDVDKEHMTSDEAYAGATLTYTFTITNTGDVTLHDVSITDSLTGMGLSNITYDWSGCVGEAKMAPGENATATATYQLKQSDIESGEVVNNATVNGTPSHGDEVTDDDDAKTDLAGGPSIVIEKTVAETKLTGDAAHPGTVLHYSFVIENTGNLTLTDVTLTDELSGVTDAVIDWSTRTGDNAASLPEGTLVPGQQVSGTATYTMTQDDVDAGKIENWANVKGTSPGGQESTDRDDATTTVESNPSILLEKVADPTIIEGADAVVGKVIGYTFAITNTGNVTLTDVNITDSLTGKGLSDIAYDWASSTDASTGEGVLSPGENVTATATYPITQDDIKSGSVTNNATAHGNPPAGTEVTDDDDAKTDIAANPAISIEKIVDETHLDGDSVKVGAVLHYSFVIENTGNVILTDVTLTDEMSGVTDTEIDWSTRTGDGADALPEGTLVPGQQVSGFATYKLTQIDIDAGKVTNWANVIGKTSGDKEVTDRDDAETTLEASPGIDLIKTADPTKLEGENAVAGSVINYTFTITNTGKVTLHDVSITDSLTGFGLSDITYDWSDCTGEATMAPGEVATATAKYEVKQSDVESGTVVNSATAHGVPPTGDEVTDDDEVETPIEITPSISIEKTVDKTELTGDDVKDGAVLRYSFVIMNTGNVTLTGVMLTDELPGIADATIDWDSRIGEGAADLPDGTLAPGQTVNGFATYVLTQADIDAGEVENWANVNGTSPDGQEPTDRDDAATTIEAKPAILLEKVADPEHIVAENAKPGTPINYTLIITNTGNVTLTGVNITDALDGISDITYNWDGCVAEGTLSPGQSATATATYALTQDDVENGSVTNTATAHGNPPTGDEVTDDDDAKTDIDSAPAISIEKTVAETELENDAVKVGATLHYSFIIENTGNVILTDVTLEDEMDGVTDAKIDWATRTGDGASALPEGTLMPGQQVSGTASYKLTQTDIDAGKVKNWANVKGTPADGDDVTDRDDADTTIRTSASISLEKVADPVSLSGDKAVAGATITYTFTIENTGKVTLSDVSITDELTDKGLSDITYDWSSCAGDGVMAPGQKATATATYTVTQADVEAAGVLNRATVNGTPQTGEDVTDDGTATTVIERQPDISIVKTASESDIENPSIGDEVEFIFEVTNDGNVTLTDVDVTDPLEGLSDIEYDVDGHEDGSNITLAPGESFTAYATYHLTQADIDAGHLDNTAETHGNPPSGEEVTDDDDVNVHIDGDASLSIEKDVDKTEINGDEAVAGTVLTYHFVITNTGKVTVHDIAVDDDLDGIGIINLDKTALAPGESTNGTATYRLTQDDVDSGRVVNVARATGKEPSGDEVKSPDDDAETTIEANPHLTLSKTASTNAIGADDAKPGYIITWYLTVRNDGNVTVSDIEVEDMLNGVSDIDYGNWSRSLSPGAEHTVSATYAITQADIERGLVNNTAVSHGKDPSGAPVDSNEDGKDVMITSMLAIRIEKKVDKSKLSGDEARAGTKLTYSFVITNIGNAKLTDIAVDDYLAGISDVSIDWTTSTDESTSDGTLGVGESVTATAIYTVTQSDVDAGSVLNTAIAHGTGSNGDKVDSNESTVKTDIDRNPSIEIVKSVDKTVIDNAVAGNILTYTFVITNTGNVTLDNVSIDDSLSDAGLSNIEYDWSGCASGKSTMKPGEKATAKATYAVTSDDIKSGKVDNVAKSKGTGVDGKVVDSDPSDVTTVLKATSAPVAPNGNGDGNAHDDGDGDGGDSASEGGNDPNGNGDGSGGNGGSGDGIVNGSNGGTDGSNGTNGGTPSVIETVQQMVQTGVNSIWSIAVIIAAAVTAGAIAFKKLRGVNIRKDEGEK